MNLLDNVADKINKIGSSEEMKSVKKYAEKKKKKLFDYGINLKGKISEKINELKEK